MRRRASLRSRLTVVVTLLFAIPLILAAALARDVVERSLRNDARENAETLLAEYIAPLEAGPPGANPRIEDRARILFIAPNGDEISEADYQRVITEALDQQFSAMAPEGLTPPPAGDFSGASLPSIHV